MALRTGSLRRRQAARVPLRTWLFVGYLVIVGLLFLVQWVGACYAAPGTLASGLSFGEDCGVAQILTIFAVLNVLAGIGLLVGWMGFRGSRDDPRLTWYRRGELESGWRIFGVPPASAAAPLDGIITPVVKYTCPKCGLAYEASVYKRCPRCLAMQV